MNTSLIRSLCLFFFVLFVAACSKEADPVDDMDNNNPGMNDPVVDNLPEAPDFSLTTTSGDVLKKADFKGKTVVVFFFGFNCPPCKAVAPSIETRLHQEFKNNEKFVIIGADQWDGNNAGVDKFKSDTGVTFPLGVKGSSMAKAYGTTFDRLAVINKNGKLLFKGNSVATNNLQEVIDLVKKEIN